MIINVYVGGGGIISVYVDGKSLRVLPPFFPDFGNGFYTLDTATLPEGVREEFETRLIPYILED